MQAAANQRVVRREKNSIENQQNKKPHGVRVNGGTQKHQEGHEVKPQELRGKHHLMEEVTDLKALETLDFEKEKI
ncbi:hypothetical protein CesoFtcFv8_002580 [Champsocephalus esox]|uniref:Uncharacterized protein n=1 Tax=Champsocephalus esox TaxID=159716 RepID=A0AAN8D301_9TELE|nr:hypothetical protein CesoFtcFv8_002580 [Champsocephalus esox]